MSTNPLPVLYTFRRCPYAIRARMALVNSGIKVDFHEVSLKNKPQAMLDISDKGTVPVLLVDDKVIDESLDIMQWALTINDPDAWFCFYSEADKKNAETLIQENDNEFKVWLDKYKYADRFPEYEQDYYRQKGEVYLTKLEKILQKTPYLIGSKITLADMAIFPFIRQFSMVNQSWFDRCPYKNLRQWLKGLLGLPLFIHVMAKVPTTPTTQVIL